MPPLGIVTPVLTQDGGMRDSPESSTTATLPLHSGVETGQTICAIGIILVELQIPNRLGTGLVSYFKDLRTFGN